MDFLLFLSQSLFISVLFKRTESFNIYAKLQDKYIQIQEKIIPKIKRAMPKYIIVSWDILWDEIKFLIPCAKASLLLAVVPKEELEFRSLLLLTKLV